MKSLYLKNSFCIILLLIAIGFALSFGFNYLFPVLKVTLIVLMALVMVDVMILFFQKQTVFVSREMAEQLSLGDVNKVKLTISSSYSIPLDVEVIDELPYQLQERSFSINAFFKPKKLIRLTYTIHPLLRGNYNFGDILIFTGTPLNFVKRRVRIPAQMDVPVYPSIIQMKKFEILSLPNMMLQYGVKKVRRIGHSYEFEQIRNYALGDDVRNINWKASAKSNSIMVNQFEEERSQQIYCIVDRSRVMKMPFNGLSLLDYAINSSLVISNTALKKNDRAGLISYAENIDSKIKANNKTGQLNRILQSLYNEKQSAGEANYELLYNGIRNMVKTRSLLFLFTNFESVYALRRVLNLLRRLNKSHLLVVIFFENTELKQYSNEASRDLRDVYFKTAAKEFLYDKEQIALELRKHKIQTIYTKPEDLTINVLNKYLELKARGAI